MARFVIQILVITIGASILQLFMPWWSIAIAGLLGGYVFTTRVNFLSGFVAIAALWLIMAIIIDISAAAPLAERVAAIFPFKTKPVLFAVTALLGGLVGGFASMAGGALKKDRRRIKYY